MAEDSSVVEHLLEGRRALEREVARLTAAMEQLDSVIALFDGSSASSLPPSATSALSRTGSGGAATRVNASTTSRRTRKAPTGPTRPRGAGGQNGQKSIREHVLDMLAAENREVGLAEIIDRIHGAGVQAHDDAVRSITIKLMKDGQVERVGRGQYRLARSNQSASSTPSTADGDTDGDTDDGADHAGDGSPDSPVDTATPEATADGAATDTDRPGYTPPLNLGQPWN